MIHALSRSLTAAAGVALAVSLGLANPAGAAPARQGFPAGGPDEYAYLNFDGNGSMLASKDNHGGGVYGIPYPESGWNSEWSWTADGTEDGHNVYLLSPYGVDLCVNADNNNGEFYLESCQSGDPNEAFWHVDNNFQLPYYGEDLYVPATSGIFQAEFGDCHGEGDNGCTWLQYQA